GRLRFSAHVEGAWVVLEIEDTGVGMDEESLARVFEPYFSTKSTGTGLGLPIARRNIELSGGTISVQSEKGRGTTVTIRLPVAAAACLEPRCSTGCSRTSDGSGAAPRDGRSATIARFTTACSAPRRTIRSIAGFPGTSRSAGLPISPAIEWAMRAMLRIWAAA